MALSKNTQYAFEVGDLNELPVLTNVKIYENALVGVDAGTGYARPLTAGDAAAGFAESPADNTGGASGALRVRVKDWGKVVLAITSLAITDIGKAVYASDDGTFTLTAGSNSFVGVVDRWISTGVGLIAFDFRPGVTVTALTAATGTGSNTISDVGGAFNQTTLNNNFKSLADKVNTILQLLK